MVDEEGGEVGEEGHAEELGEGPFPRAGFTTDYGGGGEALEGVDEEDDDGEADEGGVEFRAIRAGGAAEGLAHGVAVFFVSGVGDGEGGAEDFPCGEGGDHGSAHVVIPAEGGDDGLDGFSDLTVEGVCLLGAGVFRVAFRVGI